MAETEQKTKDEAAEAIEKKRKKAKADKEDTFTKRFGLKLRGGKAVQDLIKGKE